MEIDAFEQALEAMGAVDLLLHAGDLPMTPSL